MHRLSSPQWTLRLHPSDERRLIVAIGVVLVAAHLAFRAWVILPAWFFLDDFNLLSDGRRDSPDLSYLLEPYNGHLMPGGRLIAWMVAQGGAPADWTLAASITLVIQALAGLAALWMLLTLFGTRWGVIGILAVWLTTALTIPSFLWWAAALDLLAIQVAFFLAVGAWVRYLRDGRLRWLGLTVLAVLLGLFFWVKALLIVLVLAYIGVAYFTPTWDRRTPLRLLRRFWLPALLLGSASIAYVLLYLDVTPDQFSVEGRVSVMRLIETTIGTTFATGAVGGPWRWNAPSPPTAYVFPPGFTAHLTWAFIGAFVLTTAVRRRRTGRAWMLLVGYCAALVALLYSSRAQEFGAPIGLEPRYLADGSMVLALVLGLVTMELAGAPGSSRGREPALLTASVPSQAVVVLVLLVSLGGVLSSVRYAAYWHDDNAAQQYMANVKGQLPALGKVDLAQQGVPEEVMSNLAAPRNNTRFLLPLVTDRVSFPDVSDSLLALDDAGTFRRAAIKLGVASVEGPVDGCGWRVTARGETIPLQGRAFDYPWWLRVGYLYNDNSPVTFTAGGEEVTAQLRPGLGSLYFRIDGTFDEVEVTGIKEGTVLCIDRIEVGDVVPGGPL